MAIKIKVHNQIGEAVGEMNLSDKVFGVETNNEVIRQVVVSAMANQRKVLAHTKTRSNVRGGGKKPWKQKGTGRARAGTIRSPLWVGGGITFGPLKDRNFKMKINKKMNQKAICMALSDRAKNEKLVILNEIKLDEFKTKKFEEIIKKLEIGSKTPEAPAKEAKAKKVKAKKRSVLMILDKKNEGIVRSGKNLAGVQIINSGNVNLLDLLKYRELVITEPAVKILEERYGKKKTTK